MNTTRKASLQRLKPAAAAIGVLSGVLGADALLVAAEAADADVMFERANRGSKEAPPTTEPPTTVTTAPETTTTTVTTVAPAPVVPHSVPAVAEEPAPVQAQAIEPPPEPVPAPAAAPRPAPKQIHLARTGDGAKPLSVLAGAALALGGAAILTSANPRRRPN